MVIFQEAGEGMRLYIGTSAKRVQRHKTRDKQGKNCSVGRRDRLARHSVTLFEGLMLEIEDLNHAMLHSCPSGAHEAHLVILQSWPADNGACRAHRSVARPVSRCKSEICAKPK